VTEASIPPRASAIAALLLARCPRCRTGRIFRGFFVMHRSCPLCGLSFHPEPGYFTAAWAISYFLAFPVVMVVWLGLARFVVPDWPIQLTLVPAMLVFVVLSPLILTSARVLWLHLDRTWKPQAEEPTEPGATPRSK
jgi:uncharacterized protein (DUF983 family)